MPNTTWDHISDVGYLTLFHATTIVDAAATIHVLGYSHVECDHRRNGERL